jgi:arylsulfatase A-like enzyme
VLHPAAGEVQDYVVFTWDDWQAGQANPPYLPPPNHIVSIRERRWKLAEYYDADGNVPDQWEMYDLENDPEEWKNLAWPGYTRTDEEQLAWERLRIQLEAVKKSRLQPLGQTS